MFKLDVSSLVIPEITDPLQILRCSRARNYKQYVGMVEGKDRCWCCQRINEPDKIVAQNGTFLASHCNPPEKNTQLHIILFPKRHILCFSDYTHEEEHDWFEIQRQIKTKFNLTCYGELCRDKAIELAGTVEHHHSHMMVPNGMGRVESPFNKGPEAEFNSLTRAVLFERIRQMIKTGKATTPEEAVLAFTTKEQEWVRNLLD